MRNPSVRPRATYRSLATATLFLLALCSPSAKADSVTTSPTAFLGALSGTPTFQSFEGLTATNNFNVNTITVAGFTMTAAGTNSLGVHNVNVLGSVATDGVNYVRWLAGTVTFTFATPVTAFGLTFTDALDGGSTHFIRLSTNGGTTGLNVVSGPQPSATQNFVGFIATNSFTQITFVNTLGNDGVGIDGIYFQTAPPVNPVPEPASILLMASGAAALALRRRFGTPR